MTLFALDVSIDIDSSKRGSLLEALDQGVLVADLAALVACVLLGPGRLQ